MPSVVTYLLSALGVYWIAVFYRRWVLHARTQQFVLEQRRKAGIPDTDKRPLAVAAADAAQRRQRLFEEQMRQSEDVFGPAQPAPRPPAREKVAPRVSHKADTGVRKRAPPAHEPRKRERADSDTTSIKRNRTETQWSAPIAAYAQNRASRKRQADAQSEIHEDDQDTAPARKARRKVPDEELGEVDEDMDDIDEEMEDVSSASQPDDSDEIESMDEEDELVPGPEHGTKRAADTSNDHSPGDEWIDANGLRWCVGEDGVPRRLVTLVEMKPKYRMPRDAMHSDAKVKVPSYIEKFLSQEEYEEAKRKKQLSWQHELALSKNSAANSPLEGMSDDVEDSLASLVSRRSKATLRKGASELLYNDTVRTPHQLARSRASSIMGDDSFGASLSERSDDSRSFTSSISGKVPDMSNPSGSRRVALARSPAHSALRAPRYSGMHGTSSPLSPARGALDQAAKRKREEQLMAQIQESRKDSKGGKSASKESTASASNASLAGLSKPDANSPAPRS